MAQKFPADGEQWSTGIRDIDCLDWSPADSNLYGIVHARDSTNRLWPDVVSAEDDNHIADEMHRITKGTDVHRALWHPRSGYNVVFVPFERTGKAGSPTIFADGFAGFDPTSTNRGPATIGIAEGPDGALYVADSQQGRVWRIALPT